MLPTYGLARHLYRKGNFRFGGSGGVDVIHKGALLTTVFVEIEYDLKLWFVCIDAHYKVRYCIEYNYA